MSLNQFDRCHYTKRIFGHRGIPGRCHVKIGVTLPQAEELPEARRDLNQTLS